MANIQPVVLIELDENDTHGLEIDQYTVLQKLAGENEIFFDKAVENGTKFNRLCSEHRYRLYQEGKLNYPMEYPYENLFFSAKKNKYVIVLSATK